MRIIHQASEILWSHIYYWRGSSWPSRIAALQAIPQPRTARDLQQFLMAAQWMSRTIPEYNGKEQSMPSRHFWVLYEEWVIEEKSVARQLSLVGTKTHIGFWKIEAINCQLCDVHVSM